METVHLTLHYGSRIINETISKEMNLLEALNHIPEISLDAPCGGKGTCGKCRIRVINGYVSPLSKDEEKLLDPKDLARGVRLACKAKALGPVELELENSMDGGKIQTSGKAYRGEIDPVFDRILVKPSLPSLEDQRSDEQRLMDALPEGTLLKDHNLRKKIPRLMRGEEEITVTTLGNEIISLTGGDRTGKLYAIAVDIGTTTVVAYLINLRTGEIAGTSSGLNRQKSFGGDVISRIDYIGDDAEKLRKLQERILVQLESYHSDLILASGVDEEDIFGMFLAGNTTMMHILAGMNPKNLAVAPFIPVSTSDMILTPQELGTPMPNHMRFILLPSLSAYIGADIVAGILSTGMNESEDICLLVDIGTNGEIALGNKDRIVTCSTAAGPAFEGANIQCGTGGIPGAISVVSGEDGILEWKTINDKPAIGICGSGIIDVTAYLLRTGIADYTGRFTDEDDWQGDPPKNIGFLDSSQEDSRFILTRDNKEIFFSQKDLREVQLAKGSIGAGIATLISEYGVSMDKIKKVYLAGGFGSYIDKQSALDIGLLPSQLSDRIESVGNSCGAGVIKTALNRENLEKCRTIRETSEYLELSSHSGFQEEYILNMYFPQFG